MFRINLPLNKTASLYKNLCIYIYSICTQVRLEIKKQEICQNCLRKEIEILNAVKDSKYGSWWFLQRFIRLFSYKSLLMQSLPIYLQNVHQPVSRGHAVQLHIRKKYAVPLILTQSKN